MRDTDGEDPPPDEHRGARRHPEHEIVEATQPLPADEPLLGKLTGCPSRAVRRPRILPKSRVIRASATRSTVLG